LTADERLTSREAESLLASTRDWRQRKARLDAVAAAVIPCRITSRHIGHEESVYILVLLCCRRWCRSDVVHWGSSGCTGDTLRRAARGDPARPGPRAIGDRLVAAGIVRDSLTFRAAPEEVRATRLKAGAYRFAEPIIRR
jgi:hypothetical protein